MPCWGGVYVPPSSSDKVIGSLGMYNIKYSWVYERTSRWFLDCTSASNMNIISHLGKCFKTFETPMMCISKWIQYGCDDGDLSFNDFCVSSMYQSLTLSKTQDELCRKASRSLEIAAAVVEEVHEMATNIYKVDMLAGWTCDQWEVVVQPMAVCMDERSIPRYFIAHSVWKNFRRMKKKVDSSWSTRVKWCLPNIL